jgi:hypothetical protein
VGPVGSLAIGTLLGVTILLAALALPGPSQSYAAPQCPSDWATVQINGTPYWCTTAPLNWNDTAPGVKLNVTFHYVLFRLDWYSTYECSVVNVTGHEETGGNSTLFVIPNCTPSMPVRHGAEFPGPNYFSPDHEFGATWVSYPSMQLYVQAPSF